MTQTSCQISNSDSEAESSLFGEFVMLSIDFCHPVCITSESSATEKYFMDHSANKVALHYYLSVKRGRNVFPLHFLSVRLMIIERYVLVTLYVSSKTCLPEVPGKQETAKNTRRWCERSDGRSEHIIS